MKIEIVEAGRRYEGRSLQVGHVVEMEDWRGRDWVARGWARGASQGATVTEEPGAGESAETVAPGPVDISAIDKKQLNALARDLGIDPRLKKREKLEELVRYALAGGEQPELTELTAVELQDLAMELEIDPDGKSKEELIAAIQEAEAAGESARPGGEGSEGASPEAGGREAASGAAGSAAG